MRGGRREARKALRGGTPRVSGSGVLDGNAVELPGLAVFSGARSAFVILVSANDALHEIVADDILLIELNDADAFDFSADVDGFDEAAFFAGRKVDLGDVSGDDGLGIEAGE